MSWPGYQRNKLAHNHHLIEQINGLKLQSLNDVQKIKRTLGKLEDHSMLVMALTKADVPWLRKLLHIALKNGASIRAIVRLIEDALEAGYRPRGHSTEANDLALLIYRLGGANLLYALNQRLHIPSLQTLRKKMLFIKIAPTIGHISIDTVQKNIHDVIIEAAVYMPQPNSVGGLCWTHSHRVEPVLHTYNSALHITNALKAETVHLSKEVTIAGAHIVGKDGFYPLLAAPTCKSEDASDMEFIFNTLINAWKATGADQRVGPLWFIATDGDATRRKGGHKTFLHTTLPITSPLYGMLSNLPGLNLHTGNDLVTLDFDFKHVFKRFCTLIHSHAVMYLNNGQCINSFLLKRYLTMIDGIDEAATHKLLYPDDPQDVPHAVSLMRAVITLSQIDPVKWALNSDDPYPNADKITDFDALKIIRHILDNLLQPYTNVNLTISEQVIHLSCFAHLLYASYRNQRHRLMPNQLYYDSQSMALGHLGAAQDIGGVFARQPDIVTGHRCLNLSRAEGVDHISRAHWVGDTVVGHCNLPTSWNQGKNKALNILKASQIHPSAYDFNNHFTSMSGINMLCVFGEARYLSINEEGDDTELEDISIPSPSPTAPVPIIKEGDSGEEGDKLPLTFEEAIGEVFDDTCPDDNADEYIKLTSTPSTPTLPKGPGIRPCDYLIVEGKPVHKFGDLNAGNILHSNSFVVGDLFLALVCTPEKSLTLALTCTTHISDNGVAHGTIKTDTLLNPRAVVKLSGDVQTLLPSSHSSSTSNPLWVWNGGYIKTSSPMPGTNITTSRVMSITVPGYLVELVNPSVVKASDHLLPCECTEVNSNDSTWALSDDATQTAISLLWDRINNHKVTLTMIATVRVAQASFPYHAKDVSKVLVCAAATKRLNITKGKAITSECPVCKKETINLRTHMGIHVLHVARGIIEDVPNPIINLNPCGYCGGPATGDCEPTIKEMAKGLTCTINCPCKKTLQYGTATKGSNTNPCRNVPVICRLCVHTVWRYNMEAHLSSKHREYSHPAKPHGLPLPENFYDSLTLTVLEEKKADVPSHAPFMNIQAKENIAPSNARTQKHKADMDKFTMAKRGQQE
ncbi:hypothetical protein PAXRUDRAFT_766452 [Paxillus rubicundulus Ve08.2h10]|uniref:Uncharacterized protein n=1 Tax=Paxillus rubicundulus Ve08.2h10 TaxID=930991 RepID=A0A0D0E0Y1_9AGAM|nr:hypothetical protein PAXRUDRAFT_766452 [Paxillus rubicundulus Ve08.2h10]